MAISYNVDRHLSLMDLDRVLHQHHLKRLGLTKLRDLQQEVKQELDLIERPQN